jgi:L-alanine-DL-glutamate epimerase-like enolase superfamily enzyme
VTTHPDSVQAWKERGFLGVKIAAPWGAADGRDGLLRMQRCVEETRTALGDGLEMMIDCYMS